MALVVIAAASGFLLVPVAAALVQAGLDYWSARRRAVPPRWKR